MKETTITDIINCPVCGHKPVLRCNASKLFQVKCKQCNARTGWKRKTDAIIMWYNMVIQFLKNEGIFTKQEQ